MLRYKTKIFLSILGILLPFASVNAGTILSPNKYAWSDNGGYINFERLIVNGNSLSGFAWSTNFGWINFNPVNGGVRNDGNGHLSGFAWGEQLGYIDFGGVSISTTTGKFSGTATGALIGTINFDCLNFCNVTTDWRPSLAVVAPHVSSPGRGNSLVGATISSQNPAVTPFPVLTPVTIPALASNPTGILTITLSTPAGSKNIKTSAPLQIVLPSTASPNKHPALNNKNKESISENNNLNKSTKRSFWGRVADFFGSIFHNFFKLFQ